MKTEIKFDNSIRVCKSFQYAIIWMFFHSISKGSRFENIWKVYNNETVHEILVLPLSYRPAAKALSLHTQNMEVDEDADQNLDLLIGFANKGKY